MTKLTKAQAEEFNDLVDDVGSPTQITRIRARLRLTEFVKEHGKEACDEAFAAENKRRGIRPRKRK